MLHSPHLFSILILISIFQFISSNCLNGCNQRGTCTSKGLCDCYPGFYGPSCELKNCPLGTSWVDIPSSPEEAHGLSECSSKGICDRSTGTCECFSGFTGDSCDKLECPNDCSGHGRCLSLRQAAHLNDGFKFNYTTTYNLWDADKIYGCKCDYGYIGSDCSQRECEYGPDPRIDGPKRETVNFVCECDSGSSCNYKFKLSIYGSEINGYFQQTMTVKEFRDKISDFIGLVSNEDVNNYNSVTSTSSDSDKICQVGSTVETSLSFRRNIGNLPQLYISNSRVKDGKVYFNTYQKLVCDCTYNQCTGSFRFSFDGQVSSNFASKSTPYEILREISYMPLIQQESYIVEIDTTKSTSPLPYNICLNGKKNEFVYKISGKVGNAPQIIAMSSIVGYRDNYPTYISNDDSNLSYLYFETEDGIASESKMCNGIGKCNFETGICQCPQDWGPHEDLGPCGGLALNVSTWEGFGRCPGVVSPSSFSTSNKKSLNMVRNNPPLAFISLNTLDGTDASIHAVPWDPETIRGSVFDSSGTNEIITLTSSDAAGPIIYDQSKDRIFYANNDPTDYFIGYVSVSFPFDQVVRTSVRYVLTEGEVFSLVFDAHFHRRNIYWSIPSESAIYKVNVDLGVSNPTLLVDKYQSSFIVNPTGISLIITKEKLYWTDTNSAGDQSVINQANLDLTDQVLFHSFSTTDPDLPVSKNLRGNVIHLNMNNTMFILDGGDLTLGTPIKPQVIAVNLDSPIIYNTDPDVEAHNEQYYSPRLIVSNENFAGIDTPHSVAIDFESFVMVWSEPILNQISFLRYKMTYVDITSPGISFTGIDDLASYDPDIHINIPQTPYHPIGIAYSNSLSEPNFGNYLDCYGSGVCLGVEKNFMCECYPGYDGDCQMRTCPKGLAWFHEPRANNIAHDVYIECSGVGTCDYFNGKCKCNPGFEGNACERMSCQAPSLLQAKLARDSKASITNTTSKSSTSNYFQFHQNIEIEPACGYYGGRCLSMQSLGNYNLNIQKDFNAVSYSLNSNLPSPMTWDSQKIYGCKADTYGFFYGDHYVNEAKDFLYGAHFQCPSGYNRRFLEDEDAILNGFIENNAKSSVEIHDAFVTSHPTTSPTAAPTFAPSFNFPRLAPTTSDDTLKSSINRREIQTISCIAAGGHFRLKFRGKLTDPIPADATPYELKLYLESLPTVGKVNVRSSKFANTPNYTSGSICTLDGKFYYEVEFLSLFGPAPLLQVEDQTLYGSLGTIDIYSIQKSTDTGLYECSQRGICNERNGECECVGNFVFSNQNKDYKWTYFSSDGCGKLGTRGDCGVYLNK